MKRPLLAKLALSAAIAASTIGCLAQSTYKRDREADEVKYYEVIGEINSRLDASQRENDGLRKEIQQLRDIKVGIPAEILMRHDDALTRESMVQARLRNRTERRIRSDFDKRIMADIAGVDSRTNTSHEELYSRLGLERAELETRLNKASGERESRSDKAANVRESRFSASIAGINSGIYALEADLNLTSTRIGSDIAGVDSRSNTSRSQLEARLGKRFDSGEAGTTANEKKLVGFATKLQQYSKRLDKQKEEYSKLASAYGDVVNTSNSKILALELKVQGLEGRAPAPQNPAVPKSPNANTPKSLNTKPEDDPKPRRPVIADDLVDPPTGRDLYLCIVGRNFRYFSKHVARITYEDLSSVMDPNNNYMSQDEITGTASLLSRDDKFTPVKNRSQLNQMLSSETPTPIFEISGESLQKICDSGKMKIVDRGIRNRDSRASYAHIEAHTRGSNHLNFYLTARLPSEIKRR